MTMISRRKLFGLVAAGALVAPELLLPRRTIFLPPRGGWPHGRLAALIIPPEHAHWWAPERAAGKVEYDLATQTMTLLRQDKDVMFDFEPNVRWDGVVTDRRMVNWAGEGEEIPDVFLVAGPTGGRNRQWEAGIVESESMTVADPLMRAKATARAAEIRERMKNSQCPSVDFFEWLA
jgi:hypothetical protein